MNTNKFTVTLMTLYGTLNFSCFINDYKQWYLWRFIINMLLNNLNVIQDTHLNNLID